MNRDEWHVCELQANLLKALAHPIRVAALALLSNGDRCVCEIAEQLGAERSNVSRHLSVLANAGVVEGRKEGLRVVYSLRTRCVLGFLSCATEVLRRRAEDSASLLRSLRSRE